MRDPTAPLLQTLNLTHGGKGKQKFVAVDALNAMKWDEFKTNMILYVDSVGSGYVPSSVVLDSGYRLEKKQETCAVADFGRAASTSSNVSSS